MEQRQIIQCFNLLVLDQVWGMNWIACLVLKSTLVRFPVTTLLYPLLYLSFLARRSNHAYKWSERDAECFSDEICFKRHFSTTLKFFPFVFNNINIKLLSECEIPGESFHSLKSFTLAWEIQFSFVRIIIFLYISLHQKKMSLIFIEKFKYQCINN